MSKLIMEHASFIVLDIERNNKFKIQVNGQGEMTIRCSLTDLALDMEIHDLKLIYDAVKNAYDEGSQSYRSIIW